MDIEAEVQRRVAAVMMAKRAELEETHKAALAEQEKKFLKNQKELKEQEEKLKQDHEVIIKLI